MFVLKMSSQTTSSTPRKAAKRGRKPKSNTPSDFCRIMRWLFCYLLGESWQDFLHIWGNIFRRCHTVWHSSTTNKHDTIVSGESSFYNNYFGILYPKSPLLSSENKLVFRFTNQQKHILLCLLCGQSNGRNPKLFHLS